MYVCAYAYVYSSVKEMCVCVCVMSRQAGRQTQYASHTAEPCVGVITQAQLA